MLEATLIAAARLGDDDAFTELYQQQVAYVRGVGRSILRTNDLDDFCQDVFLLAFGRLHDYEGGCSFRNWLTRIAINQGLMVLRSSKALRSGSSRLVQVEDEMAGDDVLERYNFVTEDAQLRSLPVRLDLEKLMARLRPAQRRVLEMAYVEGIPDIEIAAVLGMSVNAVKNLLFRGRQSMREMFDEE